MLASLLKLTRVLNKASEQGYRRDVRGQDDHGTHAMPQGGVADYFSICADLISS